MCLDCQLGKRLIFSLRHKNGELFPVQPPLLEILCIPLRINGENTWTKLNPNKITYLCSRIRVPLPNANKPQGSNNWSRNTTFHLGTRKTTPGDFHSSSRFKDVTGRERVKYYSRPVLPGNQSSVPLIKYAPDVSQVPDDFTAEFLARRDSYSKVRRYFSCFSHL